MNKESVTKALKQVKTVLSNHSPEILTGIGIAGMITTTVLAVKATPKALMLIEDAKEEKKDKLTVTETVKAAWKPYIPAVVTCAASTACLIGASSVSYRRNAALTAAYNLSTSALREYQDKVKEVVGEKKEQTIREKIAQDAVDENPPSTKEVFITGGGQTLCFDKLSGRYFKSDRNRIDKAVNTLNFRMTGGMEMCISLNEFYDELGLSHLEPLGDSIGWNVNRGLITIDYDATLTDDDEPCMVIDHVIPPEYNYHSFY